MKRLVFDELSQQAQEDEEGEVIGGAKARGGFKFTMGKRPDWL
jgi:hypothetical protein